MGSLEEQLKFLKIVKVKSQLKDEKIEKVLTYHYSLDIEEQIVSQIFQSLTLFSSQFPLISSVYISLPFVDFVSFLEEMKNFEGEIWVDKRELLPKKVFWQKGKIYKRN